MNMSRFNLAIDKVNKKEKQERYKVIDLTKFNKQSEGFSSYDKINEFTTKYNDYDELFNELKKIGLVNEEDYGDPFVILSDKKENKGTKKHNKENKIIFKNGMELVKKPSSDTLKHAYEKRIEYMRQYRYNEVMDNNPADICVILPITIAIQKNVLPDNFNKNNNNSDNMKYAFILELIEELQTIINEQRKSQLKRHKNEDISSNPRLCAIERTLNECESELGNLRRYVTEASSYGHNNQKLYNDTVIRLIHLLCIKPNTKANTYSLENSIIFRIATFIQSFKDLCNKVMETKIQQHKQIVFAKELKELQDDEDAENIIVYESDDGQMSFLPMENSKKVRIRLPKTTN